MKVMRAFLAGLTGALAMSLAMFLMRSLGFGISLEALLGSIFDSTTGLSAWTSGFLFHLGIGTVMGILYALAFEAGGRAGPAMGGGLGLAHGLAAGMLMSGIPAMNPITPSAAAGAPGPFLANVEYGPILFLAVHFIYGLTVGVVYGRPVARTALTPKHAG
jgi:hypothetical protein